MDGGGDSLSHMVGYIPSLVYVYSSENNFFFIVGVLNTCPPGLISLADYLSISHRGTVSITNMFPKNWVFEYFSFYFYFHWLFLFLLSIDILSSFTVMCIPFVLIY